jgi:hypothetical protein
MASIRVLRASVFPAEHEHETFFEVRGSGIKRKIRLAARSRGRDDQLCRQTISEITVTVKNNFFAGKTSTVPTAVSETGVPDGVSQCHLLARSTVTDLLTGTTSACPCILTGDDESLMEPRGDSRTADPSPI